jgi:hypothetical protein
MTPLRIFILGRGTVDATEERALADWLRRESAGYLLAVDEQPDVVAVVGGDVACTMHVTRHLAEWSSLPVVWWRRERVLPAPLSDRLVVADSREEFLGALWMHEMQRDFASLEVP